ncbi:protein AKNAD1 [Anomaloglossus baeobatrachus]|uniref:protein AKNAD1 n=1 Tax=Anomaloglossus baeobatrachus TaxID=238106 RepID=UPI003F4FAA65
MEYSADNVLEKRSVEPRHSRDHSANDTTDDEQEDLPYDGILECYLVPNVQHDNIASTSTPTNAHQAPLSGEESPIQTETTNDEALYSLDSSDLFSLSETISNLQANDDIVEETDKLLSISTIIPDVLLRHITENNLVSPSEFIGYETMPEISIIESSDETAFSRTSDTKRTESPYDGEQEGFKEEYLEMYGKENNSIQENMTNEAKSDINGNSTKENNEENECESIQENVEEDDFPPDDVEKESKQPMYEPHRRPSYEMKYGQGQVHYKLPDFSKVPPKVKIPKCDNGSTKPSHTMKKATTSTNLIGQSFLIQDILDSMQPVVQPGLMKKDQQHEQVLVNSDFNCDISPVSPPALECFPSSLLREQKQSDVFYFGLRESSLGPPGLEEVVIEGSQNMEWARVPTEGSKMTGLLMEQAQTLKKKVESFSDNLCKKSLSRKEQLLVFQSFKSSLETLEIDYLSTKEKHRDLQLQIYRTGNHTVGEFDIEREVEGQIFRLGMLLEDIQEQMSKSDGHETESASLTTSNRSHVLSPTQETEDVGDPMTVNSTDKAVTRSPNRTTVSETQIQQDLPMVKEAIDSLHPLCLCPDISTILIDTGLGQVLSDHSTVNSANQEATMISSDIVPLILSGQPCKLKGQNYFYQESSENWIIAKQSGFEENRQITTKLKKDIEESRPHLRYQDDKIRKTERKFKKPSNLSIFVQEKAVNLDLTNCNGTQAQDFLTSEWLVSSHSGLFQYRSKSSLSNGTDLYEASSSSLSSSSASLIFKKCRNRRVPPAERHSTFQHCETAVKAYPTQKSLWSSTFPLGVQNQSRLSNRPHHIHSHVSHYMPSSRSSGHSSGYHHSQSANSTLSTLQRKRRKNVTPNNLDDIDCKILNCVLDNALRTAKNMQKTTERMVQRLALAIPPSYRSSCAM